ncbi:accessory Sec system translocase SecA2 [Microbacterium sp. BWT-B31]|uniref:accessory Sec system translocase SecA2 n=1 Tax=Microbacterium sp. BWT-B31 TaxID=3232072 RepID=UPI003528794F
MKHVKAWLARALGAPGSVSFRSFRGIVEEAGRWHDRTAGLTDAELVRSALRELATGGGGTSIAPTAKLLAVLSAAAERSLGQRAFDEQLLACCALLAGHCVELDTGEGKTLVGALAAAGFALAGRRVHVLSVNDYLAQRDAEWMSPLLAVLGLRVGWVGQLTPTADRRQAYLCDVVYASVSEVGYDVLRDRFATTDADRVRPALDVAIVDEADAVMIDEALSPLVLAGSSPDAPEDFALADALVRDLEPGTDFAVDADRATVTLTDAGLDRLEARLGGVNLYEEPHSDTLTRINLALHAHVLIERDVDYLVVDGGIKLINTTRGRLAHQQRWPDGLHAAIEAKEQLEVSSAGVILDTLTVHDLLRRCETLVGMSGTVIAVAEELAEFYELTSGRVDRRLPNRRVDEPQRVFTNDRERTDAAAREVRDRHRTGQPVLVGTQSVAASDEFAALLARLGVPARVLNARNDEDEAAVIARAGEFGAVTISTQMSGRGTDIRLGGLDERDHARVAATGGLAVVQIGRYPSGRLDAQLRGRAGRQGDPGCSVTFVSTQDELVQANAPAHLLEKTRRKGTRLDQAALGRIVDTAQRIAEGIRRDRHRDTWDFTRAIVRQRDTVLARREEVMDAADPPIELTERIAAELENLTAAASAALVSELTRSVTLWCLDEQWRDHLANLSEIRDGIHLRALAGVKPRDEFHRIALREFAGFFTAAFDRAAGIVRGVTADQLGRGIGALGLRRPSATWTYMMSDNPLGSPLDRAGSQMGRWMRSRVYRIE